MTNIRVEDYTLRTLLEHYDDKHTDAIERLSTLTHGRPCIILNADGTANVEESETLAGTEMIQPTSDRHVVNGKVLRVWRAGDVLLMKQSSD